MRNHVLLYLNGKRREIGSQQAKMMLADYLRYDQGLTGTKIVCAEGDCGSCTVLRAFAGFGPNRVAAKSQPKFLPINSCIVTVAQMDGSSLITVDALADKGSLTPVQSAMVSCHGSQCGFCTPGFVMALSGLVEKKLASKNSFISEREAKNSLTGNLCRCTGYQPIVDAATAIDLKSCESLSERFTTPAQWKDLQKSNSQELFLQDEDFSFYAPTSMSKAAKALAKNKNLKILGAATDLGVVHNKWKQRLVHNMSLHLISELYEMTEISSKKKSSEKRLQVGARVTLEELRRETKDSVAELSHFLDLFASPQIKNVATLVGNVANASPIADTPPFLLVAEAEVNVVSAKGKRSIPIEKFFKSYRKTAVAPGELIASITFVIPSDTEALSLKKVSERKDLDISAVNAAFRLNWENRSQMKIKEFRVALGGVGATTLRLKKVEKILNGQSLNETLIESAVAALHQEITPFSDLRGTSAFRRVLVENLFRRFLSEAQR